MEKVSGTLSNVTGVTNYESLKDKPHVNGVELIEEALNPKIGFRQENANSISIDWGDGSPLETSDVAGAATIVSVEHQYSKPGSYVIRLIPEEGAKFTFLGDSYSTRILHTSESYSYADKVYGNTIKNRTWKKE